MPHDNHASITVSSLMQVCVLVPAEGTIFGLLTDGSGWVFEAKDDTAVLEPAGHSFPHSFVLIQK